jgi:hypothetical protein
MPPIMFWITVGQARRQTAAAIGPSMIERSNLREADEEAAGWMIGFYRGTSVCNVKRGGGSRREQPHVVLGAKKDCHGKAPAARRGAPRSRHPPEALSIS